MRNRAQPFLAILAMAIFAPGCGGEVKAQGEPEVPPATASTVDQPMDEPPVDDSPQLDVLSDPPTEILLDGKPIGTSPISGYKVTPGSHDVTFVDEKSGNRTMTVTVQPGEVRMVKSDRPQTSADARPVEGEGGKK